MKGINWILPKWCLFLEKTFLLCKVSPKFLQVTPFLRGPLKQSEFISLLVSKSIPSWLKSPQITYRPLWQEICYRFHSTPEREPRREIAMLSPQTAWDNYCIWDRLWTIAGKRRGVFEHFASMIAPFPPLLLPFFFFLANVKGIGPPSHNLIKWSQI